MITNEAVNRASKIIFQMKICIQVDFLNEMKII
jgi:hypothetical protein